MSIYITGDIHGNISRLVDLAEQRIYPKKNDYIIVCGDFGVIWKQYENEIEDCKLDLLDSLPYTILFIDGNHENMDRLYRFPVKEWKGGKVHEIRSNILHLMRGQVFTIEGKKIFTFGGAACHDMPGGALKRTDPEFDKKRKFKENLGIPYRIENESWWELELPTDEEMEEGLKNLEKHNYKVDYVLTHCASGRIQYLLDPKSNLYEENYFTDYLDEIEDLIACKKWYFGHYHMNMSIDERHLLLYDKIMDIREGEKL